MNAVKCTGVIISESLISLPASRVQEDANDLLALLSYVIDSTRALDAAHKSAAEIVIKLVGPGLLPNAQKHVDDLREGRIPRALDALSAHLPLLYELIFCRVIDSFLNYISEILTLIFETKPEMLKSSEKISIEEIFEYQTREELLSALTERKVIALSFKGLVELNDDLVKKLGFQLFVNDDDFERARVIVEKRNLATHNRGCVNRRYLERVPNAKEVIGDRLTFGAESVKEDIAFLGRMILDIDQRTQEKFGIPRNAALLLD